MSYKSAIENGEGTESDENIRIQLKDSYYDLINTASDLLEFTSS